MSTWSWYCCLDLSLSFSNDFWDSRTCLRSFSNFMFLSSNSDIAWDFTASFFWSACLGVAWETNIIVTWFTTTGGWIWPRSKTKAMNVISRVTRKGMLIWIFYLLEKPKLLWLLLKYYHLVPEVQGLPLQLLVFLHTLVQLISEIFSFLFQLTLNGYFRLPLMLYPIYLVRKIERNGFSIFSLEFYQGLAFILMKGHIGFRS